MKQPPMFIPPAQAEALYDAALQAERQKHITARSRSDSPIPQHAAEDWDDEQSPEPVSRASQSNLHASPQT